MDTKIKAIIIDDEKFCCEMLKYEIERCSQEIIIVDICGSGKDGILSIKKNQPHLVFLDIEMPYMNGFEMLTFLDTSKFYTVFTTAYDQFAIEAIKVNALDYLLKPISGDDIVKCIAKIKNQLPANNQVFGIRKLLGEVINMNSLDKKIALPTSEGIEMVRHNDIMYIQADNNYSTFFLKDKRKILISKHMKFVEDMLTPFIQFIRIHQSYIININFVEKYLKGSGGSVILEYGVEVPVSKMKRDDLILRLGIGT